MQDVAALQWLGSGENKLVATAQLKLLLSFTPIPVPAAAAAALSVASDTGYHSSSSSSSSEESLLSGDEQSAGMQGNPEVVQDAPDSRGSSRSTSGHAPRTPASIQPRQDQAGPQYDKQRHVTQLNKPAQASAAGAAAVRASTGLPAAIPQPADKTLGIHTPPHATETLKGRRQDRPALAVDTTGKGRAPGLSPGEALSKLIQRAEQLRQMISATPAEGCASSLSSAKTGTRKQQHGDAFLPSTPAAEQEGYRVHTSVPATLSTVSGKHGTQQITTPAGHVTATCGEASGIPKAHSMEYTQPPNSASRASTSARQKRFSGRASPVSKLRRVAEGKLGIVGRARALRPQAVVTLQPQVQLCPTLQHGRAPSAHLKCPCLHTTSRLQSTCARLSES